MVTHVAINTARRPSQSPSQRSSGVRLALLLSTGKQTENMSLIATRRQFCARLRTALCSLSPTPHHFSWIDSSAVFRCRLAPEALLDPTSGRLAGNEAEKRNEKCRIDQCFKGLLKPLLSLLLFLCSAWRDHHSA